MSRLQGPLPGLQVRIWRICRFWMSFVMGFRGLKSETLAPLQPALDFKAAYFARCRYTNPVETGRFRARDRRFGTRSGRKPSLEGPGVPPARTNFPLGEPSCYRFRAGNPGKNGFRDREMARKKSRKLCEKSLDFS